MNFIWMASFVCGMKYPCVISSSAGSSGRVSGSRRLGAPAARRRKSADFPSPPAKERGRGSQGSKAGTGGRGGFAPGTGGRLGGGALQTGRGRVEEGVGIVH